jgi:APA family basic amino acid/polyamine antiporter
MQGPAAPPDSTASGGGSHSLFRTKSIDELAAGGDARLERTMGPWTLVALGIGAVIGSGIFILTGTAAAGQTLSYSSILNAPILDLLREGTGAVSTVGRLGAGPAISLSFILVAIVCGFAALCYAELASMIPVAGGTYTYAYAALGEIVAWIIGWDLILEYAVSNMAVAVGFAAHVNAVLERFGLAFPQWLSEPTFLNGTFTGHVNIGSLAILLVLTWLLSRGVRESASANNVMVVIKIAVIVVFIAVGARHIDPANWNPFFPNGMPGVMTGAAIVFFTYIGFDSVSTAAEECRNPQRDLPIGIVATLLICAILYAGVALVLTGVTSWKTLDNPAPVVTVLRTLGYENVRWLVAIGALAGMISSLLVFQYGQARIWFAMSRDRLLPARFSSLHPKYKTPFFSTWVAGLLVGIPAMVWDIGTFADLSNIGTLFAFVIASVAVMVLRKTQPDRPRGFRVPLVPVLPAISVVSCLLLMLSLPLQTWLLFFLWLGAGLLIYFFYSRPRMAA